MKLGGGLWFSKEEFWLPPNATWARMAAVENYGSCDPLLATFAGIVLFAARLSMQRAFASKLNDSLNLKCRPLVPCSKSPVAVARKLGTTERELARLLKRRASSLQKSAKSFVYCLHYVLLCALGLAVLWNKPWPWKWSHCIEGAPFQPIDNDVWWYYAAEMAFYTSQVLAEFSDNSHRRKDFAITVLHHITTIGLIAFSWSTNLTRIGSIVMITHDLADPILEAGKMFRYAKRQKAAEVTFGLFVLVWFITRLGIFPAFVHFLFAHATALCPAHHLLRVFLVTLVPLHLMWTATIIRICWHKFSNADREMKDTRSDSEDDSEQDDSARSVINSDKRKRKLC